MMNLNPAIIGIIGNFLEDVNLLLFAFKIVIMLFIIQFVRERFQPGPFVTLTVFALGFVILFTNLFWVFGPLMFIYLFITFGFISLLFDLAIAKPWKKMDMGGHSSGGDTSANEEQDKLEHSKKLRRGMF